MSGVGAAIAGVVGGGLMDMVGNLVGGWSQYGANKKLMAQQFDYNTKLQQSGTELAIGAQKAMLENSLGVTTGALLDAGYSQADATRMALGQSPSRVYDWSGVRSYAPAAPYVSSFSGGFSPSYTGSRIPFGSSPFPSLSSVKGALPGRSGSYTVARASGGVATRK